MKSNLPALLTILGLVVIGAMESMKIRGAILWGIIITTAVAIPLKLAPLPQSILSMPPSIAPIFWKMDFSLVGFDFSNPAVVNFWIVVFTFFFVDFFDTVGTVIGVSGRAGLLDERGNLPKAREALMADAVGTTAGAVLGVSGTDRYARY